MKQKVRAENVDGELVEKHLFEHSVSHRVNWSHVLGFVVLLYVAWRIGPAVVGVVGDGE
jgi:hypothetical protein